MKETADTYYAALSFAPTPPNPSVGTIKADQGRIHFDLDVTKKKWVIIDRYQGVVRENKMQDRFADVMITYHKRNGAFIYNQSQSEILIRILEVVFK